jgi:hypothetical protein
MNKYKISPPLGTRLCGALPLAIDVGLSAQKHSNFDEKLKMKNKLVLTKKNIDNLINHINGDVLNFKKYL